MIRRPRYRAPAKLKRRRSRSLPYMLGAGMVGATAGLAFTAITPEGSERVVASLGDFAENLGEVRGRKPQDGDYWRRCADARAAGVAPIYRGQPGYRDGLDADADGIACEPYRGL
ncbi:excalibur calcium-binding domain-containing protein [Sphingopyxis sp. SCN 67-31]